MYKIRIEFLNPPLEEEGKRVSRLEKVGNFFSAD